MYALNITDLFILLGYMTDIYKKNRYIYIVYISIQIFFLYIFILLFQMKLFKMLLNINYLIFHCIQLYRCPPVQRFPFVSAFLLISQERKPCEPRCVYRLFPYETHRSITHTCTGETKTEIIYICKKQLHQCVYIEPEQNDAVANKFWLETATYTHQCLKLNKPCKIFNINDLQEVSTRDGLFQFLGYLTGRINPITNIPTPTQQCNVPITKKAVIKL